MKKLKKLTPNEQQFSSEHHNLVWKFLHTHNLPEADFYDVVIFGYLLAVQEYLSSPILQKAYAFTTIAWKHMHHAMVEEYIFQNRPKRNTTVLEFTDMVDTEELDRLLPYRMDALEERMLDTDIVSHLLSYSTPKERTVIELKSQGYTYREISKFCDISIKGVASRITRFRNRISKVCDTSQGGDAA